MSNFTHPQAAGFTARYVWRGRNQDIIWRCCGKDASEYPKRIKVDGIYHIFTVHHCLTCSRISESCATLQKVSTP